MLCLTCTLGLLIFRLYRYRREVHSLIAARNTTKSRFVRLFIMSTVFLAVFLPYNTYILAVLATTAKDPYDWDYIHGDNWNVIIKVPTAGSVRFDVWGTIACGYLFFFLFGTGVDANNTYKRLLCAVGLGKIFPSLYIPSESVSRTSSTPSFAKGFASSCASKAKSLFSKRGSVTESYPGNSFNDSICLTNSSGQSNHIATNDPILVQDTHRSSFKDIFGRVFHRPNTRAPLLPVFNTRSLGQESASDKSPVKSIPPGVHARAWALQAAAHDRTSSEDGVHIVHEVHQAHDEMDQTKKQTDVHDWA
jgi:pheromone a factor receptor